MTDEFSALDKRDTFYILLFSILAGVANELISWVFVYRKESFQKAHKEVCDGYEDYVLSKIIPASKNSILSGETPAKVFAGKIRKLRNTKNVSTLITGLVFMGLMPAIMSFFENCAVAKLPFKPFYFIAFFTHSKTLGNDVTDCTATAIYTLVSVVSGHYTKVFLGYSSPISAFKESVLEEEIRRGM
ncbi:conserved hypothetical protein [Theileria equi strain WA]|uniref:CLAC channel n=1 Tax=Theileria equi strain WA TaxID=1537102 RepID=L1LBS1_THEEQ|nr:conserved hypothetical protein [Theileria equi strain WA]EKX72761.1 conserved hypothetical protein [Theileria equi strain WA]|eukprot:XP_004832213.1 conserved hypothetical protein [Theileria equi strain WA]